MTVYKSTGLNIDWTIGPFLDPFLGLFFFWTILSRGGGRADHKCLGRGGRQTVVTEGGVQDGLVERR